MTATHYNDSYDEFFLVSVQEKGGSAVEYAAIVENISGFNMGEKEVEFIPTASGGRIARRIPMTEESITLKLYPINADLSGTGFEQLLHPQTSDDTTQPIAVPVSNLRNLYQLVILWSTSLPTSPSTAGGASTASNAAYRITAKNCYITSFAYNMEDGKQLSAEVTFKWAPFDKSGTANRTTNATDGSEVLSAVSSFT